MASFWHNIYTFFTYIYTLIFGSLSTRKPRRQATLTPYPIDLECGSNPNNSSHIMTGSILKNEPLMASPSPMTPVPPPSPHDHTFALNTFRYNPAKTPSGHPPSTHAVPSSPIVASRAPVFPSLHNQHQNAEALLYSRDFGSSHRKPPSTASAAPSGHSSPSTPKTNRSLSSYSGGSVSTSSRCRNRHRKQSPLIWDKDMSIIAASVSISSINSRGSSLGPGRRGSQQPQPPNPHLHSHRQRTSPVSPLSYLKHDPSISYKRNAARISTSSKRHLQTKIQLHEATSQEDPVSVVRKVFGDVQLDEEKQGAARVRARIKRDTDKSFGGMDVLTEEDEDEEQDEGEEQGQYQSQSRSASLALSIPDSRPFSACSTPSTLGPITPRTPHAALGPHSHSSLPINANGHNNAFRLHPSLALGDPGFITDVDAEADDEYGGFDTDGYYGFETDIDMDMDGGSTRSGCGSVSGRESMSVSASASASACGSVSVNGYGDGLETEADTGTETEVDVDADAVTVDSQPSVYSFVTDRTVQLSGQRAPEVAGEGEGEEEEEGEGDGDGGEEGSLPPSCTAATFRSAHLPYLEEEEDVDVTPQPSVANGLDAVVNPGTGTGIDVHAHHSEASDLSTSILCSATPVNDSAIGDANVDRSTMRNLRGRRMTVDAGAGVGMGTGSSPSILCSATPVNDSAIAIGDVNVDRSMMRNMRGRGMTVGVGVGMGTGMGMGRMGTRRMGRVGMGSVSVSIADAGAGAGAVTGQRQSQRQNNSNYTSDHNHNHSRNHSHNSNSSSNYNHSRNFSHHSNPTSTSASYKHTYKPSCSSALSVTSMSVSERDVERAVSVVQPKPGEPGVRLVDKSYEVCISGEDETNSTEGEGEDGDAPRPVSVPEEEFELVDAGGHTCTTPKKHKHKHLHGGLDEQRWDLDKQLQGLDEQLRFEVEVESGHGHKRELDVVVEEGEDEEYKHQHQQEVERMVREDEKEEKDETVGPLPSASASALLEQFDDLCLGVSLTNLTNARDSLWIGCGAAKARRRITGSGV
ncbi:hypothetical protein D9758_014060 [Tetrapyrgos nigripes]|uniref:Uncharacterized protein n=1 Tax=Tetrapyrgos nigripes TaxID=182062 RepID=A0A8H5CH17_9AGAR|nr:hypothetical protein D9758_014060 [Tetrapyrgos nigripes]